jgi:hypothetical protein
MKTRQMGQCNICGGTGALTQDHVPPKGVIHATQMRLDHIAKRLGNSEGDDENARPLALSQNGIKFPTICGNCNNNLLGSKYDPALIDFVNQIIQFFMQKAKAPIPQTVNITGKPHKIMRAVIGHLCALSKGRYKKGPHTEAIRNYLLDGSQDLPEPLKFYYWIYPGNAQILVRDFVYMDTGVGDPIFTWLMKFFPVAFMITWDEKPNSRFFLVNEMSAWRGYGVLDSEMPIPINVTQTIHPLWPECPTDNSIALYGESAFIATQYTNSETSNRS